MVRLNPPFQPRSRRGLAVGQDAPVARAAVLKPGPAWPMKCSIPRATPTGSSPGYW